MNHMIDKATPPPEPITPADAGCWLDGAMGWHNTYRVIYVAKSYGMEITDEDIKRVKLFEDSDGLVAGTTDERLDYFEDILELSNKATDYLDSLAPEGYHFVWDDGLYLWADDDSDDL